jgi:hypothetical protein
VKISGRGLTLFDSALSLVGCSIAVYKALNRQGQGRTSDIVAAIEQVDFLSTEKI